jgi:hypothetical protein
MGAVIFAWVYSISFSQPPVASTVPPAIPTVTPIPDDRLALPSPTPIATATMAPTVPAPTAALVATSTAPAPTTGPAPQPTDVVNQLEPVAPVAVAPEPAIEAGMTTLRMIAEGDVQLTVVADDVVVFSGWLGPGGSTDFYTARLFSVTTSDGSVTLFENATTGQQFYMGYGANETYYLGG